MLTVNGPTVLTWDMKDDIKECIGRVQTWLSKPDEIETVGGRLIIPYPVIDALDSLFILRTR